MNAQIALNTMLGFPANHKGERTTENDQVPAYMRRSSNTTIPGIRLRKSKRGTRYYVSLSHRSKYVYLGTYDTEKEAIEVLNAYGQKHNLARYKLLDHKNQEDRLPELSGYRTLTINGITKQMCEWWKHYNIDGGTWRSRVRSGNYSREQALLKPVHHRAA